MAASQQQIAEALNLSVMTVSRALRHHPDLADSTRELVFKKAEELGYTKHLKKADAGAGSRNDASQRRLGIIVLQDGGMEYLNLSRSLIIQRIFFAIQAECQRFGIETLFETPAADSDEVPMLVRNRSVEGVFLLGRYSENVLKRFPDIPLLSVSNFVKGMPVSRVTADNFSGMYEATEHLIKLGHKKILFMGDRQGGSQIFQERFFGYLAAMQTHGLEPANSFQEAVHAPLPIDTIRSYTGLVCSNDSLAYAIKRSLLSAGMTLPDDCSIVSFDNISSYYQYGPITSYEPDWDLLGRVAANILAFKHDTLLSGQLTVTVPGQLVVHGSTCPPRA